MKHAIFVIAYNRPAYLRVCLEGIARCRDLSGWDVVVDFDGGAKTDFRVCNGVVDYLAVHRRNNLGCVDHPTAALKTALALGYEHILYCEDDHVLRSDALVYCTESAKADPGCPVSLYSFPDKSQYHPAFISNSPVYMARDVMEGLALFMEQKRYVGLPHPQQANRTIPAKPGFHDDCWFAWHVLTKRNTRFAAEQMALNIGYAGMHFADTKFDRIAFQTSPETWFDNALRMSAMEEFARTSRTLGFVYA